MSIIIEFDQNPAILRMTYPDPTPEQIREWHEASIVYMEKVVTSGGQVSILYDIRGFQTFLNNIGQLRELAEVFSTDYHNIEGKAAVLVSEAYFFRLVSVFIRLMQLGGAVKSRIFIEDEAAALAWLQKK